MIEPNRTWTWTEIWWTEPNPNQTFASMNRTEPEPRFDEPNPNLTRSSVRFGSIGTLVGMWIHQRPTIEELFDFSENKEKTYRNDFNNNNGDARDRNISSFNNLSPQVHEKHPLAYHTSRILDAEVAKSKSLKSNDRSWCFDVIFKCEGKLKFIYYWWRLLFINILLTSYFIFNSLITLGSSNKY